MRDQIDVLKELQERVLIKGGVCAFAGMQDFVRNEAKIAELEAQLDLQCATIYRRLGFDWHGRKVRYVFLAAIPVASSGFYAKLMAGIIRAFDDAKKRGWVEAATDRGNLWRAILKATRVTTK